MSATIARAQTVTAEAPEPDENPVRQRIGKTVVYTVLILYSLLVFVPFLWTLSTSFKTLPESLQLTWIPQSPTSAGYITAWTQLQPVLPVMFGNSFLLALLVTVTNVFFGAVGGYAFARLRFPGREVLFLMVLGTLMIPDQLRVVPVYQILVNLGLVAPGPQNYFGITLAWNGFFWPLIILQSPNHWTLPLGLAQFRFQYSTNWPPLMAVDVVATVPIVILYLFFQRYFVSGLSAGAVKG